MNWYLEAIKKYVDFNGRARRKEYWYFALFNVLITIGLVLIDGAMGTLGSSGFGLLSGIYALAVFLPSLAVSIRRLHDIDHTGWWVLIALIPLIGAIVLLIFYLRDGTSGDNHYGASPKAV